MHHHHHHSSGLVPRGSGMKETAAAKFERQHMDSPDLGTDDDDKMDFSIVGYSQNDLTSTERLIQLFESWMLKHNKIYKNIDEKIYRFEIFKDNLKYIDETNKKNNSYWLGLNVFADMSNDEFKEKYTGSLAGNYTTTELSYEEVLNDGDVNIPEYVDWRQKGAVTPVKNQGSCGSAWAFSAVSTIESIIKIRTGNLNEYSEQELLDCDRRSYGCNGGYPWSALQLVAQYGIHYRNTYPYEGVQRYCRSREKGPYAAKTDGVRQVQPYNEGALLYSIANQPVSVVLEAAGKDFQLYRGGIFVGPCGNKVDHAVAAVGYGPNYILIRNSWGTGWGENGYIRIKRGTGNSYGVCGLYTSSFYPVKN
uniref:Papain n=1 Tax=Carica papaya TaxID=3649 RepID=UPI000677587E|nr:Chain A, Papain [Carica papaya]4QRG_B Chain B, Papain [Carica papaya]